MVINNMGILSGTVRRLTRVAKNKNVMKTLKTAMKVTGASSIPLFQSGFNKFAGLGDRPQSEVAPTNTAPTQEVQGSPQQTQSQAQPQVGRTQQNQAQIANRQSQAEQTQAANRQAEQALIERENATRQEALLNEVRLIRTGVDLLVENQGNAGSTAQNNEAGGSILDKLGSMILSNPMVKGLLAKGGGILKAGAEKLGGGIKTLATRGMGLFRAAPAVTAGAGALTQAAGAIPPSAVSQGAESVARTAGTSGARVAGRTGLKTLGKSLLKKIPVIGLLAGVGFGLSRALKGDFTGAALELASGAASTIPGIGTVTSVGLDATLMARDMSKSGETEGQVPTPQDIQTSEVKPTLEAITQAGAVEATKEQMDTKGVITKSNQLTENNNKSITSLNDTSDINKSIVTLASTTENLDKDIVNTNQYSLSPSDIKNSSIETQLASTIANQQGNVMNSMVQGDRNLTHTSSQNMMQGAINTNVDGDRAYNEIISKTQRETDNKTIVIQAPQQQQAPVIQRIPEVGAGTAGMQAPVHTGASDSAITTITRLFMSKGIPA